MKFSKLVLSLAVIGSMSIFGASAATARHYDLNHSELMRTKVNMTSTPEQRGKLKNVMFVTGQHSTTDHGHHSHDHGAPSGAPQGKPM